MVIIGTHYLFFEGIKKRHNLTKIQKKNLRNDILKRKICKHNKIPIIYVWENEINKDLNSVKQKIMNSINYIKNNNDIEDIPTSIVPDYYQELVND